MEVDKNEIKEYKNENLEEKNKPFEEKKEINKDKINNEEFNENNKKQLGNDSNINLNSEINDNKLNQLNEAKKEKEIKKLEKLERKKNFLNKKHKTEEELENEKIFLENNKILINFLGDSITEGLKWQKKEVFCHYLSKWLNIRINNQGYRATKIARQKGDFKDFNYRLKDLDEKAEFTFIFGGTNDYSLGDAELGDINSDSYYTFYGALKNLVKDLLKKFDKDKICFILPSINPTIFSFLLISNDFGTFTIDFFCVLLFFISFFSLEFIFNLSGIFNGLKDDLNSLIYFLFILLF